MMFRWINKQPRIAKVLKLMQSLSRISMTEYHHLMVRFAFYSNTTVYAWGEMSMGQFHGTVTEGPFIQNVQSFKQVLLEKLSLVTLFNITNASIE